MNDQLPPPTPSKRTPSKTEAIVALCTLAGAADERQLRAIACACKALARDAVHKGRCHASQSRRGVYRTPKPVADAILANPPFDPAPEPQPQEG